MLVGISGKINSGKDTVGEIIQIITNSPHFTNEAVFSFIGKPHLNPKWKIKKFADKLKDIHCLLFSCTRQQLEDEDFKNMELPEEWWYWKLERDGEYNTILLPYNESTGTENYTLIKPTHRLFLQLLGTECGRQIIHPNVWVNALMSEYKFEGCKSKGERCETVNGDCDSKYCYPNWIITDTRFPNELKAVKDRGGITIRVNRTHPNQWIKKEEWDLETKGTVPHESETALDNAEFDYIIENDGTLLELINKVREILTLINSTNETTI